MTNLTDMVNKDTAARVEILKTHNEILNAREVATYLRIGYTKALSLMKHELPSLKFGNTYRINRCSLDEWLKKREVNKSAIIN